MENAEENLHMTTTEPFDVPDPLDKVSELPQPFKFLEGVLMELAEAALQQGEQRALQAHQVPSPSPFNNNDKHFHHIVCHGMQLPMHVKPSILATRTDAQNTP